MEEEKKKFDLSELASVSQAAREMFCSTTSIYNKVARGDLDSVKIDGICFILKNHKYERKEG